MELTLYEIIKFLAYGSIGYCFGKAIEIIITELNKNTKQS